MTMAHWLALLGILCSVLVTVTTWGFLSGRFSAGTEEKARWLAEDLRDYKIETSKKFDTANKETSKAWSYVQGIEARLVRDYLTRDSLDTRFAEQRRELDQLRAEMNRFKDICDQRHM